MSSRRSFFNVELADDPLLVFLILLELGRLELFDHPAALVLGHALAGEDARVDDDPFDSRRNPERGIAHLAGFLAEDRSQELLFRRELRLSLGRDLADQDVSRLDLGADPDDAAVVEVLEGLLTDVGNVARDLFRSELGVARNALELFDVNRGEDSPPCTTFSLIRIESSKL